MLRLLNRLLGCTAGVSAVEFALLAPVLVAGAFSTADVGMAIYEKMMIDQALRAASQRVMSGANVNDVHAVLEEVASQNFVIAEDGGSQEGALSIDVSRYCACPGTTIVRISCLMICTSGLDTMKFYELTASKTFNGVMLPGFGLSGSVTVLAE